MTATQIQNLDQAKQQFHNFSTDDQLALLWYAYLDVKNDLHPGSPEAGNFDVSEALVHRILQMSEDQQLQAQRDIVSGADNEITRAYKAYGPSAKMYFWYQLAQEMENGKAVNVPEAYELQPDAKQFKDSLKNLDFEKKITFLRDYAVNPM